MKDLYKLSKLLRVSLLLIIRGSTSNNISPTMYKFSYLLHVCACQGVRNVEVYKYLNGHSPDIMNDIFKLREKMYNL